MARQIGKLKAIDVSRKPTGLHTDGGGLYLRVTSTGGRFWVFRFMLRSKAREMGLGASHALTMAEARIKAADCRKLLTDGIDPITAREAANAQKQLEAARAQTFRQCAEAYIEAKRPGWRNIKHADQWKTDRGY